jgi:iron(III) transport system permease protein
MASSVGRTLSPLARRLEPPALYGLATVALVICCVLPWIGIGSELLADGALTQVGTVLGEATPWILLLRSTGLALVVTACTVVFGVPLGVLLGRSDMAGRKAALWLHVFPLFLPPFLLALGWFHVLGGEGLVGSAATSDLLFGPLGVVLALTFAFMPVVSALTALGLQGIDPSLEEAALTASRPLRAVTHILVPLAWRAIALSAIVVFALAISEIGVPMFLRVRTYQAAVFTRLGGIDYAPGEAAALVLPLLLLGLLLVAIDRRLVGRRSFAAFGVRSRETAPLRLGRRRVFVSWLAWLAIIVSLLPLAALALRARGAGLLAAAPWIRSSMATSLVSGAAAASIIVVVGGLAAHAVARKRRGAAALDVLALLAFMTPASVLGVGLISVWNRPATNAIYSTGAILVIGFVARYSVLGVRTLAAVLGRSSPHYEEAAACAGSGFTRRLFRILVPMHAREIAGAWLLALVFCLRDLDTVVVFHPPGREPLAVRIFTLEANGPERVVAGLSVYQVVLTALLLLVGGLLLQPRRTW